MENLLTIKNTQIRIATSEDAIAISSLLYESFVEYKSLYTQKAFDATILAISDIKDRIDKKTVWIAMLNNAIAGTVSMLPWKKGTFIRSLAVAPAYRGNKLGKALLAQVEELALKNSCQYLLLNTTPFLADAIRLYENFGFKQQGYDDLHGTPLIKMIKNLEPLTKNKIEKNDYAK